jgi:putative transcription factor
MMCDMCGNKPSLNRVEVEGTSMLLCEQCSSFGKITGRVQSQQPRQKEAPTKQTVTDSDEILQVITPNYNVLIKNKREKLGLKQEELAKKLSEKESLLHQIEAGKFIPSIPLARKFEKELGLTLVEEHREKHQPTNKSKETSLTIGDLMK